MAIEDLTSFEKEQLIRLLSHHMMPETRQLIARTLPQVYAKLNSVRVVVDTSGTVVISAKDDRTKFSVESANCGGCGEQWPCTVEKNKNYYGGLEAAKHSPKR